MQRSLSLTNQQVEALGFVVGLGTFDISKKTTFLEHLRTFWPNISRCCRAVGISNQTYYNHLKADVNFCKAIAKIKAEKLDSIEAVAVESAQDQKKGFLDRAMILRAHRPELYDRAKVVKIEGYKMAGEEKAKRLGAVDQAIDAEVVNSYTTRKERRRLKAGGEVGVDKPKP